MVVFQPSKLAKRVRFSHSAPVFAFVAQLVERCVEGAGVVGSIPTEGTSFGVLKSMPPFGHLADSLGLGGNPWQEREIAA